MGTPLGAATPHAWHGRVLLAPACHTHFASRGAGGGLALATVVRAGGARGPALVMEAFASADVRRFPLADAVIVNWPAHEKGFRGGWRLGRHTRGSLGWACTRSVPSCTVRCASPAPCSRHWQAAQRSTAHATRAGRKRQGGLQLGAHCAHIRWGKLAQDGRRWEASGRRSARAALCMDRGRRAWCACLPASHPISTCGGCGAGRAAPGRVLTLPLRWHGDMTSGRRMRPGAWHAAPPPLAATAQ